MRGLARRDPSSAGPGGLSLVLWLAVGVIPAALAAPMAVPAGRGCAWRQGPEFLDLPDGGLQRRVEVVAVEGLEQAVAYRQVLWAVAQLGEGDVDSGGIQLLVERTSLRRASSSTASPRWPG